jgi:hypothetical protein
MGLYPSIFGSLVVLFVVDLLVVFGLSSFFEVSGDASSSSGSFFGGIFFCKNY